MKLLATAFVLVGLLIAGSVAWAAGEMHYGNCLQAADALHPDPFVWGSWSKYADESEASNSKARVAAARKCSRVP